MRSITDQAGKASSPWRMPLGAWKDVLVQSWKEAGDDNVALIAAGVAFYAFLALVPLLGATVLSYGLIASTKTVVHDMQSLTSVMPGDAAKLVGRAIKEYRGDVWYKERVRTCSSIGACIVRCEKRSRVHYNGSKYSVRRNREA